MWRKITWVVGATTLSLVGLFIMGGRSVGELSSYARATAGETVDGLTEQLPDEVHDRKMENDLRLAQAELIDKQVQMNLSQSRIEALRDEVQQLAESVARRKRLLSGAFPILEDALQNDKQQVRFASTEFAINDFHSEIDTLLAAQARETRRLEIKQAGLERLTKAARNGELAIVEMRTALEKTGQEIDVLQSRREHAQLESATLAMITAVNTDRRTAASSIKTGVDRLHQQVQEMEARNEALRGMAGGADNAYQGEMNHHWNRLESLRAVYEQSQERRSGIEEQTVSHSSSPNVDPS